MFVSPIRSLAYSLARLFFITVTGIVAMMMMVFGPALWLLTMLVGGAAGLAALACAAATVGVALGLSPPINLVAWLYTAGLFVGAVALQLLRQKIANIPPRIAEQRKRRQQGAPMERLSRLRLVEPSRDL